MELNSDEHKLMRGAIVYFLNPEVLKQYASKMDEKKGKHFEMHWQDKQKVSVCALHKKTTEYQHIY